MTAEQRAANVLQSIPHGKSDEYWIKAIAAEIKAAVEEAYEESAKIAELWPGDGGFIAVNNPRSPSDCMNNLRIGIVKAIRFRSKEVEK